MGMFLGSAGRNNQNSKHSRLRLICMLYNIV